MEEFNFSTLTPIQQESPTMMGMMTASPLILSSNQPGCDFSSSLLVGSKGHEDTTMYITVDTGPPSNILPLLSNSPPAAGSYATTTTSSVVPTLVSNAPPLKLEESMMSPNHCSTTIASLLIGSDTTSAGAGFPNYLSSTINELSKPSTVSFTDNYPSLATSTSHSVPALPVVQSNKSECDTNSMFCSIASQSLPSSDANFTSLFCGECSVNLPSSDDFFDHWVTHHCQLQHPHVSSREGEPERQNDFIDDKKMSSDEMKNIIISDSLSNSYSNSIPSFRSTVTTGGLVMERCSVCNHIFVQGTERYQQHSLSGSCVTSSSNTNTKPPSNTIEGRLNVDTVNNNNTPLVSADLSIMVPINNNRPMDDNLETVMSQAKTNSQVSLAELQTMPFTISQVASHNPGIKRRKIEVSPQTNEVTEKHIIKKLDTSTGGTTTVGSKNCVCGVCNASVKSITSYFLHWLEHHQNDVNIKQKVLSSNPTCKNEASLANILQEVWQCRTCPNNVTKLFPDCGLLSSHVELEHGGVGRQRNSYAQPFTSACQINFHEREGLEKHERLFHRNRPNTQNLPNSNVSICSFCDQQTEVSEGSIEITLCDHYRKEHLCKCKGIRMFLYLLISFYIIRIN